MREWIPSAVLLAGCARLFGLERIEPDDAMPDGPADAPPIDAPELCVGSLTAASAHTCARTMAGEVVCWGLNDFNQLGVSTPSCGGTPCSMLPITNASLGIVSRVNAGEATTCGWTAGEGSCVGQFPGSFTGEGIDFVVGDIFVCGRGASGVVRCAGQNDLGQLGQGSTTPSFSPTWIGVSLPDAALQLTAGRAFACARLANEDVYCWGDQRWGVIGTAASPGSCAGGEPCEPSPTKIPLAAPALEIDGGRDHACARDSQGVVCWGRGDRGQLGIDPGGLTSCSAGLCSYTPVRALTAIDLAEVSAGGLHACARHVSGEVECWGDNTSGQLGDGTITGRGPTPATGFVGAWTLAAGGSHTCALLPPGRVVCAGANESGQLGNGTLSPSAVAREALRCQ